MDGGESTVELGKEPASQLRGLSRPGDHLNDRARECGCPLLGVGQPERDASACGLRNARGRVDVGECLVAAPAEGCGLDWVSGS